MRQKLLAIVLMFALLPMATEVLEAGVHFLHHGDFVHSADHAAPTDDEHGCTPLFHICGCHGTAATGPASATLLPDRATHAVHSAVPSRHGRSQDPPPHLPPLG